MNELSLFDTLFNDSVGNVFNGFGYRSTCIPKVDVKENNDSYVLEMELPGRDENSVNIELDNNMLTISSKEEFSKEVSNNEDSNSKKEDSNSKEKVKYLLKERSISSFKRSFTIPDDVDAENIKATFKNGILNIVFQRKQLPLPRKINIEVA